MGKFLSYLMPEILHVSTCLCQLDEEGIIYPVLQLTRMRPRVVGLVFRLCSCSFQNKFSSQCYGKFCNNVNDICPFYALKYQGEKIDK
jgi:hypothetical protein